MLKQAHVLPDGTRVFKSEDGSYVIDEHGNNVILDIEDVESINGEISAGVFQDHLDKQRSLDNEKSAIQNDSKRLFDALDDIDSLRADVDVARNKLDDARNAIKSGDMSVSDIETFNAELDDLMPDELPALPNSALKHLSGLEHAPDKPDVKPGFDKAVAPETAQQAVTKTIAPDIQPGG